MTSRIGTTYKIELHHQDAGWNPNSSAKIVIKIAPDYSNAREYYFNSLEAAANWLKEQWIESLTSSLRSAKATEGRVELAAEFLNWNSQEIM